MDLGHSNRRVDQLLHQRHGKASQGMFLSSLDISALLEKGTRIGTYGRAVDGSTGVTFPTGDGTQLDDMARVVLLEVCARE